MADNVPPGIRRGSIILRCVIPTGCLARRRIFRYEDDVLTKAEEAHYLAQFATLPFKPFEFQGYLGNRRIVSFGWRYDYSRKALSQSRPIPKFLLPLHQTAAAFVGIDVDILQQVLVTEYAAGAGIGWHRVKPMFQDVIAFSFVSSCALRLRRKCGQASERKSLTVNPRSAYMLRGAARSRWAQGLLPPRSERPVPAMIGQ